MQVISVWWCRVTNLRIRILQNGGTRLLFSTELARVCESVDAIMYAKTSYVTVNITMLRNIMLFYIYFFDWQLYKV